MNRRLDRDVYAVLLKLEADAEGSSRRLTVDTVYDSIKRSNSSLARQKKRPLEESIERALFQREEELGLDENDDSEAALDDNQPSLPSRPSDREGSLLNKQLTKAWNFSAATNATSKSTDPDKVMPDNGARSDSGPPTRHVNGEPRPKRRRSDRKAVDRSPPKGISTSDIVGIDAVLYRLMECVCNTLFRAKQRAEAKRPLGRSILLYGPPGCGKTSLANAVAASAGVAMISVFPTSLVGGTSGESEKNIRDVFDEAISLAAPCIIFIDEIDQIGGKRESAQKAMEGRMISELGNGMDRVIASATPECPIVILAATNRPDSLDTNLRRRFGVELAIGMPDQKARQQILQSLCKHLTLSEDVDFEILSRMTPGFNGADLSFAVEEAVNRVQSAQLYKALGRAHETQPDAYSDLSPAQRDWLLIKPALEQEPDEALVFRQEDFVAGISATQPAAKKEGFSTVPNTNWSNVGALHDIRKKLEMTIIGPIRDPESFAQLGIKPAAGVLLWGPPGCGKTLIAKAVANESKANFISIKGPELLNKYVGESERAVRQLFTRAKTSAPCILFFDEMDALASKRNDNLSDANVRVVNTLLTELDGVEDRSGVFVIGATNRPDMIDPAIRRPGRLGTSLYVGLPSAHDRGEILTTLYRNRIPGGATMTPDLMAVAQRCDNFSGADLENLMHAAGLACYERTANIGGMAVDRVINMEDWETALKEVRPSVTNFQEYEALRRKWS
jgi:ribosome biogenesis ATPase